MHMRTITIAFIIGLALGVFGALYLPKHVRPYLPESLVGKETVVTGTVLAKQKQGSALLVTVNTSAGALLAVFRKNADEVNLLVAERDEIDFTLQKYSPFIDDPKITKVVKEQKALSPGPAKSPPALPRAAGKGPREAKPQGKGKPAAVAPAPANETEGKQPGRENAPPAPGDKKTEK